MIFPFFQKWAGKGSLYLSRYRGSGFHPILGIIDPILIYLDYNFSHRHRHRRHARIFSCYIA